MKNIKEIYRQAFGDGAEFENALFEICHPHLKVLEKNGEAVSLLFSLPCLVDCGNKSYPAHYIFAAATAENHRKKGYMEALLKSVVNNSEIFILRPANERLVSYYAKFGFKALQGQDSAAAYPKITPLKEFETLTEKEGKTADGEFTLMAVNLPCDIENLYFPYTMN